MFLKLIYGESKYCSVCGKMIGNTKDCWYAMLWNEVEREYTHVFVFCHHGVVQRMEYLSPICVGKVILVFKSHRFGQGNWYSKAHMLGGDPLERPVWPLCPS